MNPSKENNKEKSQKNIEKEIQRINARIEQLKIQYNLFFTGEMKLPPEKEREQLEKIVRRLLTSEFKSPRINLLVQNVTSSFSLYNNMWLKKMNEIETGMVTIKRKKVTWDEKISTKQKKEKEKKDIAKEELVEVSLNDEASFEKFYDKCTKLLDKSQINESHKENVINSLKVKLISQTIIDAKVSLSISQGKLKVKLKK